jgi:hypothetical protein
MENNFLLNKDDFVSQIYEKLKKVYLDDENKLIDGSLFLSLLKSTTNKNSELLNSASVSSLSITKNNFDDLKSQGIIRNSDLAEKYNEVILTAHGIWIIETQKQIITFNKLLDYIQESKFEFQESQKNLSPDDKVILVSLIGIRAFSEEKSMNLQLISSLSYWVDIFCDSIGFLRKNHILSNSLRQIETSRNVHEVAYIMAHANSLPKIVQHIYKYTDHQRYYLDIPIELEMGRNRLEYILNRIFPKIENRSQMEDIHKFLCDLAYNYSGKVIGDFEYINPDIDKKIFEILRDLYINQ